MPSRVDEVRGKLAAILAAPAPSRGTSESERLAAFVTEIRSIIMSDPDVLCYVASLYFQSAASSLPLMQSLAQPLAEAIVSYEAGAATNDSVEYYKNLFFTKYSSYIEDISKGASCINSSHSWVASYRAYLLSVASSTDDQEVKDGIRCILLTTPQSIESGTVTYPSEIEINSNGSVTLLGSAVDASLFVNVGDILFDNSVVTSIGNNVFTISGAATGTTRSVIMGYSSAIANFNFPTARKASYKAMFTSLLDFGIDTTNPLIKQGIIGYGLKREQKSLEVSRNLYKFDKKTLAAYNKMKKACTKYGIPDGIDILVAGSWSTESSRYEVMSALKTAAGDAMLVASSRRI